MNAYLENAQLRQDEARLNITFNGQNADLREPVPFSATDGELLTWAREAIVGGALGELGAVPVADLRGYVVDRFPASPTVPMNRIFLRPLTPFG